MTKVESGGEYLHMDWGRVMVIYSHPHDGACLIVERAATAELNCDDLVLDTCEASDLHPIEGKQWPYLGFTK